MWYSIPDIEGNTHWTCDWLTRRLRREEACWFPRTTSPQHQWTSLQDPAVPYTVTTHRRQRRAFLQAVTAPCGCMIRAALLLLYCKAHMFKNKNIYSPSFNIIKDRKTKRAQRSHSRQKLQSTMQKWIFQLFTKYQTESKFTPFFCFYIFSLLLHF